MNVDSLILDSQAQNLLGENTMLMVSQFGRDWIEPCARMSGCNSLGQLEFSILIIALRTTIPSGFFLMVWTLHLYLDHSGLRRCGYLMRGVGVLLKLYGMIRYNVMPVTK